MKHSVAVVGASGKMGTLAVGLIEKSADFSIHTKITSADPIDKIVGADLVLDLSLAAVSPQVVDAALNLGIPALVGTSGWNEARLAPLRARLETNPDPGVIVIPNFSLGSVLATRFATLAASLYDSVEIMESHHAAKADSPSGTAIRTAELIAHARSEQGPVSAPHPDQRARGQQVSSIPIHSMRLDGILAEQEVIFGAPGETLRIKHVTSSAASYESGIMLALRELPKARGLKVGLDALGLW